VTHNLSSTETDPIQLPAPDPVIPWPPRRVSPSKATQPRPIGGAINVYERRVARVLGRAQAEALHYLIYALQDGRKYGDTGKRQRFFFEGQTWILRSKRVIALNTDRSRASIYRMQRRTEALGWVKTRASRPVVSRVTGQVGPGPLMWAVDYQKIQADLAALPEMAFQHLEALWTQLHALLHEHGPLMVPVLLKSAASTTIRTGHDPSLPSSPVSGRYGGPRKLITRGMIRWRQWRKERWDRPRYIIGDLTGEEIRT
jgi:hypothetical protein